MFDAQPEHDGRLYYALAPYLDRFPQKMEAWRLFKAAVRHGDLLRGPCEVCGDPRSHGHHPDYSVPLCVMWLCLEHHVEWHAKHGPGLNGGDEERGQFPAKRHLAGRRFGRLVVQRGLDARHRSGDVAWLCLCDCGQKVVRATSSLTRAASMGIRASCKACLRTLRTSRMRDVLGAWVEMYRRGEGLYGSAAVRVISSDIRDAIAGELGFAPVMQLDGDVTLSSYDGFAWASAATVEILDSLPLTRLMKKQIAKNGAARKSSTRRRNRCSACQVRGHKATTCPNRKAA